ncbi:MAG: hypothetical protein KDA79_20420 [Planctomycetaceae bacterium]|nr:hypothetical protein [Planctomycetaceae bacterium]
MRSSRPWSIALLCTVLSVMTVHSVGFSADSAAADAKAAAAAKAAEAKAAKEAARKARAAQRAKVIAERKAKAEALKRAIAAIPRDLAWPPAGSPASEGTVTIQDDSLLEIPEAVLELRKNPEAAPFVMAKTAPKIDITFHRNLGEEPAHRRLWSSWGDICLASDGRVYVGIGDHGHDADGDARCFLYCWDPAEKSLTQIVDMNQVVPAREGQPAWSKVHAKIDEGPDGAIYFSCTLNAGNSAGDPKYGWNESLTGGQIYRYDPSTGETAQFASLPPKRCTATSLVDSERGLLWCNLEAGEGDALWALDLKTRQVVYKSDDGAVSFNRSFAMGRDGSLYFNGKDGLMRLDPETKTITATKSSFGDSPGMRSVTRQSESGHLYGTTHGTSQLFRYHPETDRLELLGPNWTTGMYTTVTVLSPDEKFVYYLPGAHGQAFKEGTPVVQYNIATGERKVLAFLADTLEQKIGYVPGGTYGIKLSADGGTLYVNLNGHATDKLRPANMKPIGFGLTSFAAIHIPESER